MQAKLIFLDWWPPGGRPVARHPMEPPEAHSAGRQVLQFEMEPVATNDFSGVIRGSSAVQATQFFGHWWPRGGHLVATRWPAAQWSHPEPTAPEAGPAA